MSFGLILGILLFGCVLPTLFFAWMEKKGWIKPGGFLKYGFDNYSGNVLDAGHMRGKHSLYFPTKKKPRSIPVKVVLTSGSLTMEFRDQADGTVVCAWRNGDPLRFQVPVRKGQTLAFYGQASHFTGSICFR